MKWPVGRWHISRLMGWGFEPEMSADYYRFFRRIYDVACTRSPKHAEGVTYQKLSLFFARAWSIERERTRRLRRELEEVRGGK